MAQIGDDVGLAHIDEQVVLEGHGPDCFCEDAIANLKILDEVRLRVRVKADLELAPGMFFFVLFLAGGDDEIVYDLLGAASRIIYAGSRAIRIFFACRLMNHGWRTAVSFHFTLSRSLFLWERALASKVSYTIIGPAQRILARQSMLI